MRATRLACYIEGDYGRAAAAEDMLNVLERKQAGMAAFTGAANNFALGLPDYLVFRQYAKQETDYDRFLNYMYSADAIQEANPNAYKAGEVVVDAISLTKAGTKFAATGAFQLADDALELAQKGVTKDFEKELYEYITGTVRDKTIEQTLSAASERLY